MDEDIHLCKIFSKIPELDNPENVLAETNYKVKIMLVVLVMVGLSIGLTECLLYKSNVGSLIGYFLWVTIWISPAFILTLIFDVVTTVHRHVILEVADNLQEVHADLESLWGTCSIIQRDLAETSGQFSFLLLVNAGMPLTAVICIVP
eukprot:UN08413